MTPDPVATVTNYESMVEAFRAAKDLRGLSNAHCDELANLAAGHTDAILGPTGRKNFGPLSFNAFCWAFAVKFVMVPDPDREKEMAEYWADRQRECSHVRATSTRVSKIIIERAKPHILSAMGRAGGLKTSSQPSASLRNAKAGKSRMRKLSKKERSALARMGAAARWKTG
jgi:hypothetical protein